MTASEILSKIDGMVSAVNLITGASDSTVSGAFKTLIDGYHTGGESTPVLLQDKTVSPSETEQTVTPDSLYDGLSSVKVNAVPSNYVGSSVPRNGFDSISTNGNYVRIEKGYYDSALNYGLAINTSTPSVEQEFSGNTVTLTPKVSNSGGYAAQESVTGRTTTVRAAQLVSGTKEVTENGTYDVTNYKDVNVNIAGILPAAVKSIAYGTHNLIVDISTTDAADVIRLPQGSGTCNVFIMYCDSARWSRIYAGQTIALIYIKGAQSINGFGIGTGIICAKRNMANDAVVFSNGSNTGDSYVEVYDDSVHVMSRAPESSSVPPLRAGTYKYIALNIDI